MYLVIVHFHTHLTSQKYIHHRSFTYSIYTNMCVYKIIQKLPSRASPIGVMCSRSFVSHVFSSMILAEYLTPHLIFIHNISSAYTSPQVMGISQMFRIYGTQMICVWNLSRACSVMPWLSVKRCIASRCISICDTCAMSTSRNFLSARAIFLKYAWVNLIVKLTALKAHNAIWLAHI